MMGFDPDVPAGYQDADLEMLEMREAANKAHDQEQEAIRMRQEAGVPSVQDEIEMEMDEHVNMPDMHTDLNLIVVAGSLVNEPIVSKGDGGNNVSFVVKTGDEHVRVDWFDVDDDELWTANLNKGYRVWVAAMLSSDLEPNQVVAHHVSGPPF